MGVGQNWLKPSPIQRGRGGTLLSSCRGGRTCAVQPGPRVSTSGVPPRPGVSPPAAAFRARMASVVGFLLYWAASLSAARGPAGLAWGGPEQPSVDDTRASPCSSWLLERIGRKRRRALTTFLNTSWSRQSAIPLPRRRDRLPTRHPRWHGWPAHGVRFGEASHPGPHSGTPVGGERQHVRERSPPRGQGPMQVDTRVFCPVPTCPCADPLRARGWRSVHTMQSHIDAHMAGSISGDVPAAWLAQHNRQRCAVCGLSVACRFGIHPTCRPEARAAMAGHMHDTEPGTDSLPSILEIHGSNTPTLRRVPHAARHSWSKALTRALALAHHHNTEAAWKQLLMLPQAVLDAPPRGGKKHHKALAAYTLDRLARWHEGERMALWTSRHSPPKPRRQSRTSQQRRELATGLAREGWDGKACAALLAEGLCPETPATVDALKCLHPQQPHLQPPDPQQMPPCADITPETVAAALRSFPAGTSPGPTGLRAQHLLDASSPGDTDCFIHALTQVVLLLARGHAPASVAVGLAGAGLVAVPKPSGGVRPIAIGEILRRLVGKCLLRQIRDEVRTSLWPAQVGVCVPAGAETAVHTARAWVHRHGNSAGKAVVKLDFHNAFNTISRAAVLQAVQARFPGLTRWAWWCYGGHTCLRFGSSTLTSAGGVQQGDPLGPLFFALAIQALAEELQQGVDLAVFYLDDGLLAGDIAAVSAALTHLQHRAASLGLTLNLHKSEVIAVGSTSPADLDGHFPAALLYTATGASRVMRNFELLGAPIGDDAFCAAHTVGRVEAAERLLDGIADLEDPQIGLRLLRRAAGHSRLAHNLRCAAPGPQGRALRHFDDLVRTCFETLTGLHPDAAEWEQATRGLGHGGLGLRSTVRDSAAAYLASVGGCSVACTQLDPHYSAIADSHAASALSTYNQVLGTASPLTLETAFSLRQKALTLKLDIASWERQLASSTVAGRAVLLSEAEPGARAFLAALPSGRTRIEPALFTTELGHRLGMTEALQDGWCPQCDSVLDRFSYHAAVCVAGGERVQRHNALRDLLHWWLDVAGLKPEKENPDSFCHTDLMIAWLSDALPTFSCRPMLALQPPLTLP